MIPQFNWKSKWSPRVVVPTAPPEPKKWVWYFCTANHCKILSDHQPTCPVCNLSMV